jgi:hypothetical protein
MPPTTSCRFRRGDITIVASNNRLRTKSIAPTCASHLKPDELLLVARLPTCALIALDPFRGASGRNMERALGVGD